MLGSEDITQGVTAMLIRKEQREALSKARLQDFEDKMVLHLACFSPPLFKAAKEEQIRLAIRFGIAQGDKYGFSLHGPLRLYLELMLLFGSHFDTDPQYPWATEVLKDRKSTPQMQRAEFLYERTRHYRAEVAGPGDSYTFKSLRSISALARNPLPITWENLESALLDAMGRVYPQKKHYVGEENLKLLIAEGISKAHSHQFTNARSAATLIVLMFSFGHKCHEDPLYPWIGKTLEDRLMTDPEAKARRLEKKALTWLEYVLASFGEAKA
ncbi:hypothetical protein ACN28S_58145 [Cystobacter fuscus]